VRVIGIEAKDQAAGEFVLESLLRAVEAERVTLEDMALVTKGADGKVKIHQTKDSTSGKGAFKGGLVGAVIGLAAPPLLAATVVGAGAGAIWGKFRDRGVNDDMMKSVADTLERGQAIVFALGSTEAIEAIDQRIKELTDGDMTTFTVDPESADALREIAAQVHHEAPPATA
jgi:uncharacterized membrane protein